jgi:hypothetical protein
MRRSPPIFQIPELTRSRPVIRERQLRVNTAGSLRQAGSGPHLFPDLKRLAHLRARCTSADALDFGSVWLLFRTATPREHAAVGPRSSRGRHKLGFQLLGRDKPMDGLRIFIGHPGWSLAQLEAEIERTLKRVETEAIFSGQSEHLALPASFQAQQLASGVRKI